MGSWRSVVFDVYADNYRSVVSPSGCLVSCETDRDEPRGAQRLPGRAYQPRLSSTQVSLREVQVGVQVAERDRYPTIRRMTADNNTHFAYYNRPLDRLHWPTPALFTPVQLEERRPTPDTRLYYRKAERHHIHRHAPFRMAYPLPLDFCILYLRPRGEHMRRRVPNDILCSCNDMVVIAFMRSCL